MGPGTSGSAMSQVFHLASKDPLMASACPSGHLEAMGRKRSGCRKGLECGRWQSRDVLGSLAGDLRGTPFLYLNTLALALYATFQTELHFLGSPAFTLSYSLHCCPCRLM